MNSEKGLIFFPTRQLLGTPADYGLDYQEVFFPAADSTRLHGWFVPAGAAEERPTLLWFHGNAGNIGDRLENLALLHRYLHIAIFIFDYREFGRSAGRISKAGTYLDAQGAWDYLIQERRIDPATVLVFGRSLGSALAVDLASRHACLGVVLEAAFTSSADMLRRYFPWGIPPQLSQSSYDNLGKIHLIQRPLLFIHGEYDEAIPLEMGRLLFEAAREPKRFYLVTGAGHNDTYLVGGRDYFHRWRLFLEQCLAA